MTTPEITPTDTQDRIIEAAYRLFLSQGFHATSMRQIAQEAGIAVASIYNHFEKKDDIFGRILVKYHPINEILPEISELKSDSVEDILRAAAAKVVSRLNQRQDFINLLLIEIVEFRAEHMPEIIGELYPRVAHFLQENVFNKKNMRPIPTVILMRAFFGMFIAYALSQSFIERNIPGVFPENTLDIFIDIFLHGILIPKEVPQ